MESDEISSACAPNFLLMVTGQRREEVAGAHWHEIDLDRSVWRITAERTKNGRPHDVPLSSLALSIFEQLPRRIDRDLIFGNGKGPFSGWSKSKERLDQRSNVGGWRLHDLRRTLVTGMAEPGIQPHVIEAVVNHVIQKPGPNLVAFTGMRRLVEQFKIWVIWTKSGGNSNCCARNFER